jgi:hypothetical protein
MATIDGVESGSVIPFAANPEFKEFLVKRDKDRPFIFEGVRLAYVRESSFLVGPALIEAAVYRTRGGKYITALSKNALVDPETVLGQSSGGYSKAAVHDTFEEAMGWFRPGRLTDAIRKQLGLDEPLRIA